MYIFGIDIPMIEILLGLGFISIIILVELIAILVIMSFHMKRSKRLEEEIIRLTDTLMTLQSKEYRAISKLRDMSRKEEGIIYNLRTLKGKPFAGAIREPVKLKQGKHGEPKKSVLQKVDDLLKGIRK